MQLRGVDFKGRHSSSKWAEDRFIEAINTLPSFTACRLGASAYDDRIAKSINKEIKEPDVLVIKSPDFALVNRLKSFGFDLSLANDDSLRNHVIQASSTAVEIEFSPYAASEMKGRNWTPSKRSKKDAPTAPNIFVKDEDLPRLSKWSNDLRKPVLICHIFDQEGFCFPLQNLLSFRSSLVALDEDGKKEFATRVGIFYGDQRYDRIDAQGAAETKKVFKITPFASIKIGSVKDVEVTSVVEKAKTGKYVSQVVFKGGKIELSDKFISLLQSF